jgi:hypothetical protein
MTEKLHRLTIPARFPFAEVLNSPVEAKQKTTTASSESSPEKGDARMLKWRRLKRRLSSTCTRSEIKTETSGKVKRTVQSGSTFSNRTL